MNIRRILILVIALTFSIYLVVGTSISLIAIRGAQDDVAAELSTIVSTSVAEIVTEPLKLGSFIEARSRIQSFITNGLFECAELTYDGMPIAKCEKDKKDLKAFEAALKLNDRFESKNPVLITYVNQSKLVRTAFKRSLMVIVYVFSFGLVFLLLLVFITKVFAKEIQIVSDEMAASDGISEKISFISEMNIFRTKMKEFVLLKQNQIRTQTLSILSNQVAHDIRSPLSALNMVMHTLTEIPDTKRELINDSLARINDIANDLLTKNKFESQNASYLPLQTGNNFEKETTKIRDLIEKITNEKNAEYSNNLAVNVQLRLEKISSETAILFPKIELSRILSNLINNSVEAVLDDGTILIEAWESSESVYLRITDLGIGIAANVLSKLTAEQLSTKQDGFGIGLFAASANLKAYGHRLSIQSKENVGTQVTITFNRPTKT